MPSTRQWYEKFNEREDFIWFPKIFSALSPRSRVGHLLRAMTKSRTASLQRRPHSCNCLVTRHSLYASAANFLEGARHLGRPKLTDRVHGAGGFVRPLGVGRIRWLRDHGSEMRDRRLASHATNLEPNPNNAQTNCKSYTTPIRPRVQGSRAFRDPRQKGEVY